MTFKPFGTAKAREIRGLIDAQGLTDPVDVVAETLSHTTTNDLEQVAFFTGYSLGQVRKVLSTIRAQRPEQNV